MPLAWHLSASELRRLLGQAVAGRASLAGSGDTTAYRAVNGDGDRLPGVTVDRFVHVAVLSLYDGGRPLRRTPAGHGRGRDGRGTLRVPEASTA